MITELSGSVEDTSESLHMVHRQQSLRLWWHWVVLRMGGRLGSLQFSGGRNWIPKILMVLPVRGTRFFMIPPWVWVELRFDSRVACERHKALSTVLNCQEMESLTVRGAQQSVWFSGVWSQDWGGDLVVWNLFLYISACISIKMLTHTYIHMHTGTPPSPSPITPSHTHTDYCQLNSTFHLSGESPSEKLLWTLKRWARGQAIRRLFCGLL